MPSTSVIMPTYNAAVYLEQAITSVLSQTMKDFELIVVDDGSHDNSRRIISDAAELDNRIKPMFLEKNVGSAGARNAGIREAKGRYVAFLDSDDEWLPRKLEYQLAFMNQECAPVAFTAYRRMDEDGHPRGVVTVPERIGYRDLLTSNWIGMLTAVYDREKVGTRFLPEIRLNHDYALWLDILRDGHKAHGLNEVLARYRVRDGSISRNKLETARYQWRVYRELEKLSLTRSLWYFMHYAYNGFRKNRI